MLHIILFHYLLHQNVNTDIVLLRKKTYYYKTVVEARQHPSFLLHRAFSDVLYCKTVSFWVTHSLFFPYTFRFYLPWREQIEKGLPWTIFIDACMAFCTPLHLHISYNKEKALVYNKMKERLVFTQVDTLLEYQNDSTSNFLFHFLPIPIWLNRYIYRISYILSTQIFPRFHHNIKQHYTKCFRQDITWRLFSINESRQNAMHERVCVNVHF